MRIYKISAREIGKCITEKGIIWRVKIYRALNAQDATFKPEDYVTMSLTFAKSHAEHMATVENEDYIVVVITTDSKNVFEAHNPGEYFYMGPLVTGNEIYRATAEEWGV